MNICSPCGEDFATVSSFDAHRVGTHDYTYSEGLRFDPPQEDGRRCLDLAELEQSGFRRDRWGRWQQPTALEPKLLERVQL